MKEKNRGLSLPELILGITIAAILGGILVSLLVSSNRLLFDQSIKVRQGLSLNQASVEITSLIKSAAGIALQYPPAGTADYTTDFDTLVLKIPAIDQTGGIITQVFDYGVLSKDPSSPKILRKQIFKADTSFRKPENKILATTLQDLQFIYLNDANTLIPPAEASRISFTINLSEGINLYENESSSSGTANLNN